MKWMMHDPGIVCQPTPKTRGFTVPAARRVVPTSGTHLADAAELVLGRMPQLSPDGSEDRDIHQVWNVLAVQPLASHQPNSEIAFWMARVAQHVEHVGRICRSSAESGPVGVPKTDTGFFSRSGTVAVGCQ
jgi:hypothetical protein